MPDRGAGMNDAHRHRRGTRRGRRLTLHRVTDVEAAAHVCGAARAHAVRGAEDEQRLSGVRDAVFHTHTVANQASAALGGSTVYQKRIDAPVGVEVRPSSPRRRTMPAVSEVAGHLQESSTVGAECGGSSEPARLGAGCGHASPANSSKAGARPHSNAQPQNLKMPTPELEIRNTANDTGRLSSERQRWLQIWFGNVPAPLHR